MEYFHVGNGRDEDGEEFGVAKGRNPVETRGRKERREGDLFFFFPFLSWLRGPSPTSVVPLS